MSLITGIEVRAGDETTLLCQLGMDELFERCPAWNCQRGACPSTKSVAPLGYDAGDVMVESTCAAAGERSRKSRSSLCGRATQLSMISKPYGARIESVPEVYSSLIIIGEVP